ncbi:hypothetical protein [Streptomyces olivaceus]
MERMTWTPSAPPSSSTALRYGVTAVSPPPVPRRAREHRRGAARVEGHRHPYVGSRHTAEAAHAKWAVAALTSHVRGTEGSRATVWDDAD